MSHVSTHILDTAQGRPATDVGVVFERAGAGGNWEPVAQGRTNSDGRIATLLPAGTQLLAGDYRLRFATGDYFASQQLPAFYPEVVVQFRFDASGGRYHLPLLLSPYGYSTYRGS